MAATAFERIGFIVNSSINDIIGKFEDPETQIDNAIIDAKIRYAKIKDSALNIFSEEQKARTAWQTELKRADERHAYAIKAVKSNEANKEADAKAFLEAEQKYRKSAEALEIQYNATKIASDKLRSSLKECVEAIEKMQQKKAEVKAKAAAAKALKQVNELTAAPDSMADAAFKRLEAKADDEYNRALAQAEMNKEINSEAIAEKELEAKYDTDTLPINDAYVALLNEAGVENIIDV